MRQDNPISKLFEEVYGDSTDLRERKNFNEP